MDLAKLSSLGSANVRLARSLRLAAPSDWVPLCCLLLRLSPFDLNSARCGPTAMMCSAFTHLTFFTAVFLMCQFGGGQHALGSLPPR